MAKTKRKKNLFVVIMMMMLICLMSPIPLIASDSTTVDIIIDKTSPTVNVETIAHTNGEYTTSVTINITNITDGGNPPSGIEKLEYSLNGGTTVTTITDGLSSGSYSFDITESGNHTLSVIAFDKAGNASGSHDRITDPGNKFDLIIHNTNTYTVTFVDYDNSILDTQTVLHGNGAIAPANPTREGYTFIGWDKPFDNITSDLTVMAQYSAMPKGTVTIRYQDDEGNTIKNSDVYTNVEGTHIYYAPDIEYFTKPAIDSVTITITTNGQTEEHTFVYNLKPLEGLNIIPAQVTVEAGNTIQYEVELVYYGGAKQSIAASDVNWSIFSGENLVSITNGGLLTALGLGQAEISATYIDANMNLFSAYADVTIIAPIAPIGTVTIKYQDTNGNTIKPSDIYGNVAGENTYSAPAIEGYELVSNNSVKFTISTNGQAEEHVFVYRPKSSSGDSGDDSGGSGSGSGGSGGNDNGSSNGKDNEKGNGDNSNNPDQSDKNNEAQPQPTPAPTVVDSNDQEHSGEPVAEDSTDRPANNSTNTGKTGLVRKVEAKPAEEVSNNNKEEKIKTGMVTGKIAKSDGTPMSNIKVELHSEIRTTFTDKNGNFRFRNVPLGTHKLFIVDERLKSGKALVGKVNVIPNTNNVTRVSNNNSDQGIAQCILSSDMPVADLAIRLDSEQFQETSPSKPTIFGSIKPTLAAAAALAAALLIILIPRRRRKKDTEE